LNNIVTLKSGSESLKIMQTGTSRKLGSVFYSPYIVTMALSSIVSKIKRYIGRKS